METINAINTAIGGGVLSTSSIKPETPAKEPVASQPEPPPQNTARDEGVNVSLSQQAEQQLQASLAEKSAESQAAQQTEEAAQEQQKPAAQEENTAPLPQQLAEEENAPEPQNFSFFETNQELAAERAEQNAAYNDALEARNAAFANYTNDLLARAAALQGQNTATQPPEAPNPQTVAERLDLFA